MPVGLPGHASERDRSAIRISGENEPTPRRILHRPQDRRTVRLEDCLPPIRVHDRESESGCSGHVSRWPDPSVIVTLIIAMEHKATLAEAEHDHNSIVEQQWQTKHALVERPRTSQVRDEEHDAFKSRFGLIHS